MKTGHSQSILLLHPTKLRKIIRKWEVLPPPADGDGEIEECEHVCPRLLYIEISNDGGRDGGVTGLPDSDQTSSQQQGPEMLHEYKGGR